MNTSTVSPHCQYLSVPTAPEYYRLTELAKKLIVGHRCSTRRTWSEQQEVCNASAGPVRSHATLAKCTRPQGRIDSHACTCELVRASGHQWTAAQLRRHQLLSMAQALIPRRNIYAVLCAADRLDACTVAALRTASMLTHGALKDGLLVILRPRPNAISLSGRRPVHSRPAALCTAVLLRWCTRR
jgi:hypothetical protein